MLGFFEDAGASSATTTLKTTRQVFNLFDFIFLFVWVMMMLVPVIAAALVRNHPIWFVINIIMLLIYVAITPAISNAMRSFWSIPELSVYAFGGGSETTFPIISNALTLFAPVFSFIAQPFGDSLRERKLLFAGKAALLEQ